MAISAYVGIPGSGKSYEVVCSVIIPACMQGRRIVTNIYGISEEKIHQYCIKYKKALKNKLGRILLVTNEQVMDHHFFPHKMSDNSYGNSFCVAGDLICIDELWRIWGNEKDIPEQHRSFLAEHRHFADKVSKVCCDLVIMNQDIVGIPRFIKSRIDTTYRMQKLSFLGFSSRYKVEIFNGVKLFNTNKVRILYKKYDGLIFSLYSSYEVDNGLEVLTDSRKNIFTSTKLWIVIIGFIILAIFSVYFVVKFFNRFDHKDAKNSVVIDEVQPTNIVQEEQDFIPTKLYKKSNNSKVSAQWRLAGRLKKDGQDLVFLSDNTGRLRIEFASNFVFDGGLMTGVIDGATVTVWSGVVKK